jgi:hypothetical protein
MLESGLSGSVRGVSSNGASLPRSRVNSTSSGNVRSTSASASGAAA